MLRSPEEITLHTEHFSTAGFSTFVQGKLLELQKSEILCDLVISNEDVSVSVHSCIFASVSPFMLRYITSQNLSCGDYPVHKKLIVPISSITKMMNESLYNCMDCIVKIVNYIYSGSISISDDHFDHIINMSCNLEIEELIIICRKYNYSKKTSSLRSDNVESKLNKASSIGTFKGEAPSHIVSDKSAKSPHVIYNLGELQILSSKGSSAEHILNGMIVENRLNEVSICKTIPSDQEPEKEISVTFNEEQVNKRKTSLKYLRSEICSEQGDNLKDKSLICKDNGNNIYGLACPDFEENVRDHNSKHLKLNCANIQDNSSLYQHYHSSTLKKFSCSFCDFSSNSRRNTAKHLLESKHGLQCSICLTAFGSNNFLIHHILSEHNFPPSYTCESCNKIFKTRHSLKNHFISVENCRKMNTCNFCKRTFVNKMTLELHISKTHNSEKSCDFCSYKTKFSSYLKRHLLKHNRNLVSCSFPNCQFQTVWKCNLKDHIKVHKSIEKEFKCDICKIGFTLKRNLLRHISLMHDKDKLFKCTLCNYKNRRSDKVRTHFLNFHKETNCKSKATDDITKRKESICDPALDIIERVKSNQSLSEGPADSTALSSVNANNAQDKKKEANFNMSSGDKSNGCSGRVVYLNEATGELTFFCDSDGKPLKGVPDVITVHSISGVNTNNNFDSSNSTSVILNETTGELSCIQLNFSCNSDNIVEKPICPTPEVTVTVLDETTGEITSKNELVSIENDSNMDFDSMLDAIDFDAMNDDSFDGFDDFENALFDAEFNVGPTSAEMDKILNEFTGELFTDSSVCQYSLDKQLQDNLWQNNSNKTGESDAQVEELAQIFLDEVTGEITADYLPL